MRKPILFFVAVVSLTVLLAGNGFGTQTPQQAQMTPEQYFDLLREDLNKDRVAIVGAAMELNSEQSSGFWQIYNEYEVERQQLGDREVALILSYAESYQSMTEQKARELATEALDLREAQLALLRSYVERLDGALGPIVAARFMQVENQIENLIDVQLASQIPLIRGQ